jgi:outer membrane protein TolC
MKNTIARCTTSIVLSLTLLFAPTQVVHAQTTQAAPNQPAQQTLQAPQLLPAALERSLSYQEALENLAEVKTKLDQTNSDPLATGLDELTAKGNWELAKANALAARLAVRRDTLRDWGGYRQAVGALEVAQLRDSLAKGNLTAAQARFKAGAINRLELVKAEAEARDASQASLEAQSDLDTALGNLRLRIGELPKPDAVREAMPKTTLEVLLKAVELTPRVIEARNRWERAKVDVASKTPEANSASEMAQAQAALTTSERGLADVRASTSRAIQTAWEALGNQQSGLASRERALDTARAELKAQETRLQQGVSSRFMVLQARIQLKTAENNLEQAQYRVLQALVDAAIAANVNVWGQ